MMLSVMIIPTPQKNFNWLFSASESVEIHSKYASDSPCCPVIPPKTWFICTTRVQMTPICLYQANTIRYRLLSQKTLYIGSLEPQNSESNKIESKQTSWLLFNQVIPLKNMFIWYNSHGQKSVIFLVSRLLIQNITDFCPQPYKGSDDPQNFLQSWCS